MAREISMADIAGRVSSIIGCENGGTGICMYIVSLRDE